jgi:hypothetical protein
VDLKGNGERNWRKHIPKITNVQQDCMWQEAAWSDQETIYSTGLSFLDKTPVNNK